MSQQLLLVFGGQRIDETRQRLGLLVLAGVDWRGNGQLLLVVASRLLIAGNWGGHGDGLRLHDWN